MTKPPNMVKVKLKGLKSCITEEEKGYLLRQHGSHTKKHDGKSHTLVKNNE